MTWSRAMQYGWRRLVAKVGEVAVVPVATLLERLGLSSLAAKVAIWCVNLGRPPGMAKFGMVGHFDGFTLTPPGDEACPVCGGALLEVVVHLYDTTGALLELDDAHGHAMPCGCRVTPESLGLPLA